MIYRVRDSVYVLGYQALLGIEYTVINRAMMPIWRAPSSGSILMPAAHAGPRAGRARPRLALGLAVSGLALALSALASRLPAGARRGLGPRTSVWPCRFPAPPALRGRGINTGRKQYILYVSRGRSTSGWLKTAATRSVVHNARRGIAPPPCTWSIETGQCSAARTPPRAVRPSARGGEIRRPRAQTGESPSSRFQ